MSLSDKIIDVLDHDVLFVITVKKAVKELKEELKMEYLKRRMIYMPMINEKIDKIFGEKLI